MLTIKQSKVGYCLIKIVLNGCFALGPLNAHCFLGLASYRRSCLYLDIVEFIFYLMALDLLINFVFKHLLKKLGGFAFNLSQPLKLLLFVKLKWTIYSLLLLSLEFDFFHIESTAQKLFLKILFEDFNFKFLLFL
jgi:hypothetical protein